MRHYFKYFSIFSFFSGFFCSPIHADINDTSVVNAGENQLYKQLILSFREGFQELLESPHTSANDFKKDHQNLKDFWNICQKLDDKNKNHYEQIIKLLDDYGPAQSDTEYKPYYKMNVILYHLVPNIVDRFDPKMANLLRQYCNVQDQWLLNLIDEPTYDTQLKNIAIEFFKLAK